MLECNASRRGEAALLSMLQSRSVLSLFNFFRSVEKHDPNPANTGTIGLPEPVKYVLIRG
ncbi:MAG: hypothetical protein C5S49_04085 [Candidatus Methanogaster sp.]|nr:MAG: hypothetical protein C5S49_04085 [ANME-2 cluster archaeon]